jgi:extracellular factor (EF) 3-hydroxypalmitic acid methyl ester biosynthesis protein
MHQQSSSSSALADTMVVCENSRAAEIRGTVLRLARHEVSFEIYAAADPVLMSEVLSNFRILFQEEPIYSGRAVVASLVNTGPVVICGATLEDAWAEVSILRLTKQVTEVRAGFDQLIQGWQKVYKITPEYKVVIADIQSFLFELRRWVEEAELGLSSSNGAPRAQAEKDFAGELLKSVVPCLDHLFQRFEGAAAGIEQDNRPTHGQYAKRQLHPLLLCAPFMHRIFRKPLGYAGDYEMVNMMLRDAHEGSSLFAKVLNRWFLGQVPAVAHRNRVKLLTERLVQEAARVRGQHRPTRVYNLGCGPAREVCDFIEQSEVSNDTQFTLLDFNEETLSSTRNAIDTACHRSKRSTGVHLAKKSVAQILKAGMRSVPAEYDLVYCAGLFDYLPDRACRQLLEIFYGMLVPGGLVVATNVDPSNPIRNIMGYIFEWWLIERNAAQVRALVPSLVRPEDFEVRSDPTGCNVFLELRKPLL